MSSLEIPGSWRRPNLGSQSQKVEGLNLPHRCGSLASSFSRKITSHSFLPSSHTVADWPSARLAHSPVMAMQSPSPCKLHLHPGPDHPSDIGDQIQGLGSRWKNPYPHEGDKAHHMPIILSKHRGKTNLPLMQAAETASLSEFSVLFFEAWKLGNIFTASCLF